MPRRAQTPAAPRRRPWADLIHRGATLGLLGGAIGLALMPPSSPAGDDAPAATSSAPVAPPLPFESIYLPEKSTGVLVVHPAALEKQLLATARGPELMGEGYAWLQLVQDMLVIVGLKNDRIEPVAALRLEYASIESIVVGLEPKFTSRPATDPDQPETIDIGVAAGGFAVRTIQSFDWLTWLRSLALAVSEVKDGDKTYYTIVVPSDFMQWAGVGKTDLKFAVTIPDERTLVVHGESWIKTLIHRPTPSSPPFLQGDAWPRISQGVVALALDNTGDTLIPRGKVNEFDEIYLMIERLRGVERLLVGVEADAAGSLTLQVAGLARDEALARSLAASFGLYAVLGQAGARFLQSGSPADAALARWVARIGSQTQIATTGRDVTCTIPQIFTCGDLATFFNEPTSTVDPAVEPARLAQPPAALPRIGIASGPSQIQTVPGLPAAPVPTTPTVPERLLAPGNP